MIINNSNGSSSYHDDGQLTMLQHNDNNDHDVDHNDALDHNMVKDDNELTRNDNDFILEMENRISN